MTLISQLLANYTFGKIIAIIIAAFGVNLVYIGIGLLAFGAFLVYSPSTGIFSAVNQRIAALYLLTQIFNLLFPILLVGEAITAVGSLIYFVPLGLVAYWCARYNAKGFTFDDILGIKRGRFKSTQTIGKRYFPLILLAIAIIAEVVLLDLWNPVLQLVLWALIAYMIILSFFICCVGVGTMFQLSTASAAKVYLDNQETIEGFIIGRSSDHINLLTHQFNLYIQISHIVKIEPADLR